MVWLPDGEKISKICVFVLIECTNVTDTETEGHRTCIASRGKNVGFEPGVKTEGVLDG